MKTQHPTYVMGDVHGHWDEIIEAAPNLSHALIGSTLIQVGDFGIGFGPHSDEARLLNKLNDALVKYNINLLVIRGNHDDPSYFTNNQIRSNIRLLADYTVEEIGGKTYLFVGGALSIDRELRLEGHSWWSDEGIKELSDDEWNSIAGKFDVVITHTAPSIAPPVLRESSIAVKMASLHDPLLVEDVRKENEKMNDLYNRVVEFQTPSQWYYGHFHKSANVVPFVDGTHFYMLDINEIRRVDK